MECCDKKFLYQIESPGLIYLTLDDHEPIYVGFQHKLRLDVRLVQVSEPLENALSKLDPMTAQSEEVYQPLLSLQDAFYQSVHSVTEADEAVKNETVSNRKDEAVSKGKRKRKAVLQAAAEVKRTKRERPASKRRQREVQALKQKEEAIKRQMERLMTMKSSRVDNVGKTKSWKLAKMRAWRKAKKMVEASESGSETAKSSEIFTCKFCFKAFENKQELFDHHKIIRPPIHLCELCDASFSHKAHLLVHMKHHKEDKKDIFKCDECGLVTKNSTGLKRHMVKHTNEKCYRCCICGKESYDFATSKMHLLTHGRKQKREEKDLESGVQGLGVIAIKQEGRAPVYTCTYCTQTFQTKKDFFNHARIINPPIYECQECQAKFTFKAFLAVHMKQHSQDKESGKQFTCDECGLDTKNPTRLKRHMLMHTGEKCYKCCVCGKESPHYGTAKLHMKKHEKKINDESRLENGISVACDKRGSATTDDGDIDDSGNALTDGSEPFSCDLCSKTFRTKKDLVNHHKIIPPLTHKCEECQIAFPFRAYLLVHLKTHGTDKRDPSIYICDECGLNGKNTNKLRQHMITHTKEQCYKCCICPKTASSLSTATGHFLHHRRAGMLRCTCCGERFPSRQALANHQLEVMQIRCELCGKEFPNRTSRTLHLKSEHPHQIIRCQFCDRVYTTQEEFNTHMVYHENNKKKQCPVCGKFVSRLDKHMLSHRSLNEMDESELWMCHKCPMKFKLKSSFIRHLASHSEERNFHCHLCPKAFTSGSELGRHLRRHSTLTPHQCTECGKWFRERRNLKSHMQVHSDTKPYLCTMCPQGFNYKSSLEGHIRSKHAIGTEPATYNTGTEHLVPLTQVNLNHHPPPPPLQQQQQQAPPQPSMQQPPPPPPPQQLPQQQIHQLQPLTQPHTLPHTQTHILPPPPMTADHLTPLVQFTVVSNWTQYNQQ